MASPLSGPANHVKHVCQELEALGHSVEILLDLHGQLWHSSNLRDYQPIQISSLEQGPMRLLQSAVRRVQRPLHLPFAAFFEALRFAVACRQVLSDCDLFIERMGWLGYGGSLASQWLGVPHYLEVNGDHLDEMTMLGVAPSGIQKWLSMGLMRWVTGHATHVITTGDGWRDRFLQRWTVPATQVTAVENGSEVVDLVQRHELRAFQHHLTATPVRLVYVGGFELWHGVTNLLYALADAVTQGANIELYLIGSGPEQATIERAIEELQLRSHVTLTGFLDIQRLSDYLRQADIGICPYCGRVEYSGLKLLDYKAAGLATIASGANGQPTVLRHGETGWIVPPCDIAQLTAAIVRLSGDHELRQQMGQAARLEAEREHSWRQTALRLEKIFAAACSPATSLRHMDKLSHEA
ncbi:MAG: glycosyltransferase family 4 protein [Caldilineaceae bacterium]